MIERTPSRHALRLPRGDWVCVTNDYQEIDVNAGTPSSDLLATSCGRLQRAQTLLEEVLPSSSVLWNNSFLCDGYDSLCWCLTRNHGLTTLHWSAHDEWTSFQSGASFDHRRLVGGEVVERSVHVAQEDKRWDFFATGEPLPEEDLEAYSARRKRDRLNEEKISALLSRLGASPWLEQFYALPDTRAFVLRREDPPATVARRAPEDVLRVGQPSTAADADKRRR